MLHDRGCPTLIYEEDAEFEDREEAADFDEFLTRFPENTSINVRGEPRGIVVRYLEAARRDVVADALEAAAGIKHLILMIHAARVIPEPIIKFVREFAKEHGMRIEVMDDQDCLWNPTKHCLAPKYRALPKEEAEELKKRYVLSNTCGHWQLPALPRTDRVIASYYGWMPGTFVEIRRPSEGAGFVLTYRVVT